MIAATLRLVQKQGVAAVSLRAVAKEVGVSHAAATHHFGRFEHLIAEAAAEVYRRLEAKLDKAGTDPNPMVAFKQTGQAYVDFGLAHPAWLQLLEHPQVVPQADTPTIRAAAQGAVGVLRRRIAAAEEAGGLRPMPGGDTALLAWSAVHGFAKLASSGMLEMPRTKKQAQAARDALLASVLVGVRGPIPGVDEPPD